MNHYLHKGIYICHTNIIPSRTGRDYVKECVEKWAKSVCELELHIELKLHTRDQSGQNLSGSLFCLFEINHPSLIIEKTYIQCYHVNTTESLNASFVWFKIDYPSSKVIILLKKLLNCNLHWLLNHILIVCWPTMPSYYILC